MTEDLFDRLARDAVPQAQEAAATQGFFSAEVDVRVDRSDEAGARGARGHARRSPRIVQSVAIDVTGPANESPAGRAAIAKLREEWLLPKGDTWRQETWTAAKSLAVGTLAASPYAAAKLTASEARIDPDASRADLSLTLDSGPAFRIGRIDIQGLQALHARARAQLRQRAPGRSLQRAGARRLRAPPARVRLLRERAGVDRSRRRAGRRRDGHAVDHRGAHQARRVRRGLLDRHAVSRERVLQRRQSRRQGAADVRRARASSRRCSRPTCASCGRRRPTGWIDTYGTGVQRTDIENLITRTAAVTARRRAIDERRTPAFGIGFFANDQEPLGCAQGVVARAVRRRRVHVAQRRQHPRPDARAGWPTCSSAYGIPGVSTEQFGRDDRPRRRHGGRSRATTSSSRALDAGAVHRAIARRHSVELPVPHRRRHDRARLRVREPRRAAGRRHRRRPLLRGGERRGRCTGSTRPGAWRRSSMPATRRTRCPSFKLAHGLRRGRAPAHADRPVPSRRRVRRGGRRACACTSRWGSRFERETPNHRRAAPRAVGMACACSHWSSLRRRRCSRRGYVFLGSQAALDYVVRRAVDRGAEGHLVIEGAEGLAPVHGAHRAHHVDRRRARRRGARHRGRVVAVRPPVAQVHVQRPRREASVARLQEGESNSQGGLPGTLALPLEVDVRNIGVERLEWKTIAQQRLRHRHHVRLRGRRACATRSASCASSPSKARSPGLRALGANPPYALSADVRLRGRRRVEGGERRARGRRHARAHEHRRQGRAAASADVAIKAGVTPFAPALVTSAGHRRAQRRPREVRARAARDAAARSRSRRGPTARASRERCRARNEAPGPLDTRPRAGRPRSRRDFAWDGTTLALTGIDAELAGNARATRQRRAGAERRSGQDRPHARQRGPRAAADLAHRDAPVGHAGRRSREGSPGRCAATFARPISRSRSTRWSTGGASTCAARARKRAPARWPAAARSTSTRRAHSRSRRAHAKFDPSRFVAAARRRSSTAPSTRAARFRRRCRHRHGRRSTRAAASPALDVAGTARGAIGARVGEGLASTRASAHRRSRSRAATATRRTRSRTTSTSRASRSCGRSPCAMRRLSLPEPARRLAARARHRERRPAQPGDHRSTRTAHRCEWGRIARAATLDVDALDRRRARSTAGRVALAARADQGHASPRRSSSLPQGDARARTVDASGTLAEHKATLAAAGEGFDATASIQGGLGELAVRPTAPSKRRGTARSRRSPTAARMRSRCARPPRVSVARDRYIEVADLARRPLPKATSTSRSSWSTEGRITTQGSFTGVPVRQRREARRTAAAVRVDARDRRRLVDRPRRRDCTGTLQRAPRERRLVRHREHDARSRRRSRSASPSSRCHGALRRRRARRIGALPLRARGDADATRNARSQRARARPHRHQRAVHRERAPPTSRRCDRCSRGSARSPSWTVARSSTSTGRGTLADPILDGTMRGDALRFDLPQYGVHLKDGTLRARLAERVDRARRVLVRRRRRAASRPRARSRVQRSSARWPRRRSSGRPTDFTIVNRPDLRLVADGKGTLALEGNASSRSPAASTSTKGAWSTSRRASARCPTTW